MFQPGGERSGRHGQVSQSSDPGTAAGGAAGTAAGGADRKKTKFVPLFSEEGHSKTTAMLPGRGQWMPNRHTRINELSVFKTWLNI